MEPLNLFNYGDNTMAHKNGLNRKDQIMCAKWLTEGIPESDIAKQMHTSVAVIKRFTQEKLDAATEKAQKRTTLQNKVSANQRKKAAILKDAIDLTRGEDFV